MDTERQIALEARFDTVLPTLATKSDVEALRADIHKWMVGSMIGLFIGFGGLAALAQLLKPPRRRRRSCCRRNLKRRQFNRRRRLSLL